ncbi:antitoxin [Agromyces indicus]|uniref:Antitoxin n=1 Tax=Agromyces indicus TaxID=758919 RepID=A0ABU1FHR2_9MICO|nr:antitoxin [Agromyces indicus]MDR5691293.1 antitoxin [Agromyces indicus]
MADFGNLGDKAKDFADSEKGEDLTDQGLDRADDAADTVSGGKFDEQTDAARDAGDRRFGQ